MRALGPADTINYAPTITARGISGPVYTGPAATPATVNLGASAILTEGTEMISTVPAQLAPNNSLLGAIGGAIGGFLTGGPVGAVLGGVTGAFGGGGSPAVPVAANSFQGTGIMQHNPLPGIQIGNQTYNPGNILPGGKAFKQPTRTVLAAPGVCGTHGYHVIKHDGKYGPAGSYCVRNRHMNPLNPRAAKRAIRRLKGMEHFARRMINAQYFSTRKSCGCKTRKPIFKRLGRKRAA